MWSLRAVAILFFVAAAGMARPAAAQTAEDALLFTQRSPAIGPRSLGLAGAGISGLADVSAFYNNPAGLGWLRQSQFTGGLSFLSAKDESLVDRNGFGNAFEDDLTKQRLGNLAALYKMPTRQGAFVIGASFHQTQTYDRSLGFTGLNGDGSITDVLLPFSDEFEVVDDNGVFSPRFFADLPEIAYLGGAIEFLGENVGTPNDLFYQAVNPGSTIEQTGDVLQEGTLKELSFGGAMEAARGVMVGVGLNFSFGTYEFDSLFEEYDVNGENTEDLYVVLDGDRAFSGFDRVTYNERFKSDLLGANLRLGVSADAGSGMRVGLTLETPTFYRVDEDFDTIITTDFDNGGSLSYGGQPGDIGRGTFEYEIRTPWRFGAGLSYSNAGFNILGDVEFVDWSQLEMDASLDQDYFQELNRTIRDNFQPVLNTRVGLEYQFDAFRVRGGVAFYPDPIDPGIRNADAGTIDRSKTYISAGFGYRFSDKLEIDFGWMRERQDDQYLPDFVDYTVQEIVKRDQFMVGLNILL
ncbi:MAG: outer membrane protein transport protein [Rhodothermales bacterium]